MSDAVHIGSIVRYQDSLALVTALQGETCDLFLFGDKPLPVSIRVELNPDCGALEPNGCWQLSLSHEEGSGYGWKFDVFQSLLGRLNT